MTIDRYFPTTSLGRAGECDGGPMVEPRRNPKITKLERLLPLGVFVWLSRVSLFFEGLGTGRDLFPQRITISTGAFSPRCSQASPSPEKALRFIRRRGSDLAVAARLGLRTTPLIDTTTTSRLCRRLKTPPSMEDRERSSRGSAGDDVGVRRRGRDGLARNE